MTRRQDVLLGLLGAAAAFGVCEAVSRAGIVRRAYLPPASEVLARCVELAGDRAFLDGIAVTLRAWALGLGLACAIAVPLGLLLGAVPVVEAAVRAVVEFLRPLPSVALIPLVSLLLGSGTETEVTLIAYASLWPVLFNTVYGLGETDPMAKDTLRAFGFGRLAVLLRVELPSTAPFIAAGIRISAAVALILAVATEILSGFGQGLGIFIAQAQTDPDGTRDVLAGVVWAGCLGLAVNGVLVGAERRLFAWARETGGGERESGKERAGGAARREERRAPQEGQAPPAGRAPSEDRERRSGAAGPHRAAGAGPQSPGRRAGKAGAQRESRDTVVPFLLPWAVLLVAVGSWELAARAQDSVYFPPPLRIVRHVRELWFSGPVRHLFLTGAARDTIVPSLGRMAAGFGIAAVAGVSLGIAVGRSRWVYALCNPVFQFARAVPPPALVPVFVVLFDFGTPMQVASIAFSAVWPVLINSAEGARATDPLRIEVAAVLRLTAPERLWFLILPSALPRIFAGLRLSLSLSLILMVFSELLPGSDNGIGFTLTDAQTRSDLLTVWAAMALLGALGFLLNTGLLAVEKRLAGPRTPAGRTA
ncbi:ABC transporter permease subunit [Streptomyces sp. FXJ1.172]|uniref:ABC transporter permease n=1 Tax=Streptomyces sp. FXJ1.172 TaxID=710705 RepID=UPI000A93B43E|nr:ABC transporter permease subunit [Streptomyces sp. FXJ1.172]WEO93692.1 ABC transporter permease subunit [Streptomyces sp. FXJ1.172]